MKCYKHAKWLKYIAVYMRAAEQCSDMEYLTNKGDLEAFIRDEYWHSLPDRVRDAERRCKKYKGRLVEFLTEGVGKPNLRICDICGQIFLEKRKEKDTLNAHMYNKH